MLTNRADPLCYLELDIAPQNSLLGVNYLLKMNMLRCLLMATSYAIFLHLFLPLVPLLSVLIGLSLCCPELILCLRRISRGSLRRNQVHAMGKNAGKASLCRFLEAYAS